jgi:hypothetical protein
VKIIWKILHSRWILVLQLDEVCYSEYYMEDNSQQVETGIAVSMK